MLNNVLQGNILYQAIFTPYIYCVQISERLKNELFLTRIHKNTVLYFTYNQSTNATHIETKSLKVIFYVQ